MISREKQIEYQRRYREKHPDVYRAYRRKIYERKKDAMLEKAREKTHCERCGLCLTRQYLTKHQLTPKCAMISQVIAGQVPLLPPYYTAQIKN